MAEHAHDNQDRSLAVAVDASRRGNLQAYARVVAICEPFLRAWLAPRCPPGIEVDEIAHRSFIVAFERLHSFAHGASFRAWLLGIARRELAAERRAAARALRQRGLLLSAQMAELAARSDAGPPAAALQALRHCLRQLDSETRVLVRQRYEEERALAAIADCQGKPLGTIKKRLYTVREWLRRCVRRSLHEEGEW